jgi:RNA polymerase sigma-70 factor (ECF subfamily)
MKKGRAVTDPSVNKGEGSSTSLGVLERARRQTAGAWEQIVSLYTPLVYSWCRKRSVRAADAEDVGQDVFRAVFRSLAEFRRDRPGDSFRAWLRTITEHKILDYRRRHPDALAATGGSDALRQMAQLARTPEPSDTEGDGDETRVVLRQALRQLQAVQPAAGGFEIPCWNVKRSRHVAFKRAAPPSCK